MFKDCSDINALTLDDDPKYMSIVLLIMRNPMIGSRRINERNYYPIFMLLDKYDVIFCRDQIIDNCMNVYPISGYSIDLVFSYSDLVYYVKEKMYRSLEYKHPDITTIPDIDKIPQIFWSEYITCCKLNKSEKQLIKILKYINKN
jgi:hypothetical protein